MLGCFALLRTGRGASFSPATSPRSRMTDPRFTTNSQELTAMANPEHLEILKRGADAWNEWTRKHPDVYPNLNSADLLNPRTIRLSTSVRRCVKVDPNATGVRSSRSKLGCLSASWH